MVAVAGVRVLPVVAVATGVPVVAILVSVPTSSEPVEVEVEVVLTTKAGTEVVVELADV